MIAGLTDAVLVASDLRRAYLGRANLVRADLTGADLTNADLSGADLSGTDLTDAIVRNTDDHGDVPAAATWVDLGTSTPGELAPRYDVDYFRIEVEALGTLTVETESSFDTRGRLTGHEVDVHDDDSGDHGDG